MSNIYNSIYQMEEMITQINNGEYTRSDALKILKQIKADLVHISGNHDGFEKLVNAKISEYS